MIQIYSIDLDGNKIRCIHILDVDGHDRTLWQRPEESHPLCPVWDSVNAALKAKRATA